MQEQGRRNASDNYRIRPQIGTSSSHRFLIEDKRDKKMMSIDVEDHYSLFTQTGYLNKTNRKSENIER